MILVQAAYRERALRVLLTFWHHCPSYWHTHDPATISGAIGTTLLAAYSPSNYFRIGVWYN